MAAAYHVAGGGIFHSAAWCGTVKGDSDVGTTPAARPSKHQQQQQLYPSCSVWRMPTEEEPRRPFAGFYNPRTTPVPDNFFDDVLPDLSGAEVKVLLYIFRRTFGWKKDSDNISLSQLVSGITKRDGTVLDRGTGLSKASVAVALASLVQKGMVRKTVRSNREDGHQPTTYEPIMARMPPLSRNQTRGGVQNLDKPLSSNRTHKKQLDKKQQTITVAKQDGAGQGAEPQQGKPAEATEQRSDGAASETAKSPLRQLPNLTLDAEHLELIAQDIVAQLGDGQSLKFYQLVARKVPEALIRETLSAIKTDGARDPRRLFTYRMQQYALKRLYDMD